MLDRSLKNVYNGNIVHQSINLFNKSARIIYLLTFINNSVNRSNRINKSRVNNKIFKDRARIGTFIKNKTKLKEENAKKKFSVTKIFSFRREYRVNVADLWPNNAACCPI